MTAPTIRQFKVQSHNFDVFGDPMTCTFDAPVVVGNKVIAWGANLAESGDSVNITGTWDASADVTGNNHRLECRYRTAVGTGQSVQLTGPGGRLGLLVLAEIQDWDQMDTSTLSEQATSDVRTCGPLQASAPGAPGLLVAAFINGHDTFVTPDVQVVSPFTSFYTNVGTGRRGTFVFGTKAIASLPGGNVDASVEEVTTGSMNQTWGVSAFLFESEFVPTPAAQAVVIGG